MLKRPAKNFLNVQQAAKMIKCVVAHFSSYANSPTRMSHAARMQRSSLVIAPACDPRGSSVNQAYPVIEQPVTSRCYVRSRHARSERFETRTKPCFHIFLHGSSIQVIEIYYSLARVPFVPLFLSFLSFLFYYRANLVL